MTNKWKKKYISFPSFLPTLCSSSLLVLSISVPYLSLHLSLFLQLLLSFFSLPSFPFNFSFALFSHFSPLLSLFLLIFLFFPHLVTFPLHSDLISFHSLPHSPFTIYLSVMWKCPPFASISSFCLLTLSFSSFSSLLLFFCLHYSPSLAFLIFLYLFSPFLPTTHKLCCPFCFFLSTLTFILILLPSLLLPSSPLFFLLSVFSSTFFHSYISFLPTLSQPFPSSFFPLSLLLSLHPFFAHP